MSGRYANVSERPQIGLTGPRASGALQEVNTILGRLYGNMVGEVG